MKNSKGFTLIELLAVIVILAIIALIAMPIILNVIETARKGSKESSALGYVDAVEKQVMLAQVDSSATKIPSGIYSVEQLTNLKVDIKGEKPENTGIVKINNKGAVSEAWFTYDNGKYKVYYDGSKAVANTEKYVDIEGVEHKDIPEAGSVVSVKTYSVGEAINYDPTINGTCESPVSTTGTKSGCMKFYVIKDNGSSIDAILDHNTTAKVAYETSGTYKEYAQASIKIQVDSDTTGWSGSPRLITANEVASITGNTTFDGSDDTFFYFGSNNTTDYASQTEEQKEKQRSFAWLFDYTYSCTSYGCNTADSSTQGYWTSSSVSSYSDYAWNLRYNGLLYYANDVRNANFYGIRPVITINKSNLN